MRTPADARFVAGYTLVEIVVVIAVSVVLFGLVLDAFVVTNRASEELMQAQASRQEALFISQKLDKFLRGYASPVEIGFSELELFSRDRLVFFSTTAANEPAKVEIQPDAAKKSPTAVLSTKDGKRTQIALRGLSGERLCAEIEFRYGQPTAGLGCQWNDHATTVPAVVGYAIRVWPDKPQFKTFKDAVSARGTKLGFEYISAVKLP